MEHKEADHQLHVFVDASNLAYGVVIFCHEQNDKEVNVRFVTAKSRVAPLKTISIPRMELMAALLGVKLSRRIKEALEIDVKMFFWTDSEDVLYWITQRSRSFKPFVANRVSKIQEFSQSNQWRYICSAENPGDLVSRGILKYAEFYAQWFLGPRFLLNSNNEWPEWKRSNKQSDKIIHEKKKNVTFFNKILLNNVLSRNCFKIETFSSWKKLTRIRAWVQRFLANCRRENNQRHVGELTSEEILDAELKIFHQAQHSDMKEEIETIKKGQLAELRPEIFPMNPKLGSDGFLRSEMLN